MSFDVTKLSDQNLKRWFQANRTPILVTLRHPAVWPTKVNQLLIHFFE